MTSISRLPACRPEPVYELVCEVMRRGRDAQSGREHKYSVKRPSRAFRALLSRINNRASSKILQAGEDFRRKIVKNLRTAPRGLDICALP